MLRRRIRFKETFYLPDVPYVLIAMAIYLLELLSNFASAKWLSLASFAFVVYFLYYPSLFPVIGVIVNVIVLGLASELFLWGIRGAFRFNTCYVLSRRLAPNCWRELDRKRKFKEAS